MEKLISALMELRKIQTEAGSARREKLILTIAENTSMEERPIQ